MAVLAWEKDLRWFKRARRAFKLPLLYQVAFAKTSGLCETLEGPVPFVEGDAIMTGLIGEHWPVSRDYFFNTYEVIPPTVMGSDGEYRKKKVIVWVMELQLPTSVRLWNNAVLSGTAGDWLVQYELGSLGIVKENIFEATYQLVG